MKLFPIKMRIQGIAVSMVKNMMRGLASAEVAIKSHLRVMLL